MTYKSFEEARVYIQNLSPRINSYKEWRNWIRGDNKPSFVPPRPDKTYKEKGWTSWLDWLGVGETCSLPKENIQGKKYGKLTVLHIDRFHNERREFLWVCKCDCGKQTTVYSYNLKSGNTTSCGCYIKSIRKTMNKTHGLSKTSIYKSWVHMRDRCNNPKNIEYKYYGGRGISVCPEWQSSFDTFINDMGIPDFEGAEIDRIDVNGIYEPDNCRWVSDIEQARNKRNNDYIEYRGVTKCLADWAEDLHLSQSTLWNRLHKLGWTVERAFTTPVRGKK